MDVVALKTKPQLLGLALLALAAGLLFTAAACRKGDVPDRGARGPFDAAFNREHATHLADSLRRVVPPESFVARFREDPFNPQIDDVLFQTSFHGPARYRVVRATRDAPMAVHFTFKSTRSVVHLVWTTDGYNAELEMPSVPSGLVLIIEQQLDGRYPTIQAEIRDRRHRFVSRSGYLKVDAMEGQHIRGTFYCEMRSQDESPQENWFELVGAFEAVSEDR